MQEVVRVVAQISSTTFIDDLAVPRVFDPLAYGKLEWWLREAIHCILSPEEVHGLSSLMTGVALQTEWIAGHTHLQYWWELPAITKEAQI